VRVVSLDAVALNLKYAVVERERRYLVGSLPEGVTGTKEIVDRYVTGTRLRLREVQECDGATVRKLTQKVRVTDGPGEVACTTCYLHDEEWAVLAALPARTVRKTRHVVARDGWLVAVDEYDDGALVAEIDDGDEPSDAVPPWLDVVRDVSDDETWTGAGRAALGPATG
jgi:CYTH domain-containing protein